MVTPHLRIVIALLLPAAAGSTHANLLVNGSFETPVIAAATFSNVTPGAEPAGFGWTVVANSVDIISNGVAGFTGPMFDGQQALDLVGFGTTGGIAQTFATVPGTAYQLRFVHANNPQVTSNAAATVTVSSGASTLFASSFSHSSSTFAQLDWTAFGASFVATGSSATLRFDNTLGGTNGGIFLDAVDVSVVPEPAAALLWLAGLGGVGVCVGRRRQARAMAGARATDEAGASALTGS